MKHVLRALMVAALTGGSAGEAFAQGKRPAADLGRVTIEDLMNIQITSASRKEQRLGDVPAAVYVITQDDIRRSGMTTLPELLRLVPGVQVAQINSNKWAVAVRGFNKLFGDKLLVLVDGRTMYDRLNSGVFWESLDIPLDQIERIEVIRGPGGATWGANAVNGVISIVTRHAADTTGAAVTVGGGTFDGAHVSARYGATRGRLAYRLSSQFAGRGQSRLDTKGPADDSWDSQTHRARLDWTGTADNFMVTGDVTLATLQGLWHPPSGPVPGTKAAFNERQSTQQYDVLGRWNRRLENGSSLQVQSFIDFRRNDDSVDPRQAQIDVDAQYHTRLATRHDLVMGGGYRFLDERVAGGFSFSITPKAVTETVLNLFVQDDIALGPRVWLTLGAKIERNSDVGMSVQPTARVMWSVVPRRHQVWGAVSRAVRSPSLGDLSGRYNFTSFIGPGGLPVVIGALGNRDFRSEEVLNVEAGYRAEAGSVASLDVTAFQGRYDNLKTSEPLTPYMELTPAPAHLFRPVQFGNLLKATTSGLEIAAHLTPVRWWRLDVGYSTFHLAPDLSPASRDTAAASFDGNAPRAQWQARSAFSLPAGVQIDAMLFHAGRLLSLGVGPYTRADLRLEVPLTQRLTASLVGQNLFDPAHAEFAGSGAIVTPTRIPRSARIQLAWRY